MITCLVLGLLAEPKVMCTVRRGQSSSTQSIDRLERRVSSRFFLDTKVMLCAWIFFGVVAAKVNMYLMNLGLLVGRYREQRTEIICIANY